MCGIFGIFPSKMGIEEKENVINKVKKILKNRGPDHQDEWIGKVHEPLLVHTRLSLIDLSYRGNQPMISKSGRTIMIYNGEIYNYRELDILKTRDRGGIITKGSSDTKVLLESIEKFGENKILNDINGMYAFATWDREKQILSIVRDRFGEKPLYWYKEKIACQDERIIFSSDLNAIKEISKNNLEISQSGLEEYLRKGFIASEKTIYKNVFRVMPGTKIEFKLDNKNDNLIKISKKDCLYWSIEEFESNNIPKKKEEDAILELEKLLENVIRETSSADTEIAMLLSGGIDSSLITAIYSKINEKKIKTFTAVYEEKETNSYKDEYLARKVANHFNTDHHEIKVKGIDIIPLVNQMSKINCEPLTDMSQLPLLAISKTVREKNIKGVLTGDGADELFGGYEKYKALIILKSIDSSINKKNLLKFLQDILHFSIDVKYRKDITRKQKARRIIKDFLDEKSIYKAVNEIYPELKTLINNSEESIFNNYLSCGLRGYMKDDINNFLHGSVLTKSDRATMSASVESRAPFLDKRIAKYAWQLPENLLIRKKAFSFSSKYILREILKKYIDIDVYNAPKRGFDVPMSKWLRGPLKDISYANIEELIQKDIIRNKGEEIKSYLNLHMVGTCDFSSRLWNLISLNIWLNSNYFT